MKKISTKNIREDALGISAGEQVCLSGTIYVARDAAHKKLSELIAKNLPLPIKIRDAAIYYAGSSPVPSSNPQNLAVGSCGPTTSKRMDIYTPQLLRLGLCCTIGKGARSPEVCEAMKRHKAIYLCAVGGAGAIYSRCIKSAKTLAFEELGCEALSEFEVEDFPTYMAFDFLGNSIFM